MASLEPHDLQITDTRGVRRLRFAASLANLGPGPLLLLPTGGMGCPARQHPAVQVLHEDRDDDGRFQRRRGPPGPVLGMCLIG